jgi:HEAT repeat protein
VSDGLTTTFQCLAASKTEAATSVLVAAFDSDQPTIRREALAAILARRAVAGYRAVIARLHELDDDLKQMVGENPRRLLPALRGAVVSADPQLCRNACAAAVAFREYEIVPALLNALEDPANTNGDEVGQTVLTLVELLCAELSGPSESGDRRDPIQHRRQIVAVLEESVTRFAKHRRREVIEALAMLAHCDSLVLKTVLAQPRHPAFLVLVDALLKSPHPSVMRLLLGFLDDPRAPSAALGVAAKRTDHKFVVYLLKKIGRQPTAVVTQNLKRIDAIAWAKRESELLDRLDDPEQHAAVRMVMLSSVPRPQAFTIIEYLLKKGKTGGRRAAAHALGEFQGSEANALALQALDDSDPEVQAAVLPQFRRRGVPGMMGRLVQFLDSPHAVVRKAARKSLNEFTFASFLKNYDALTEEARESTGELVKKVDPHAAAHLRTELGAKARTRRLRGLDIARTLGLAVQVEPALLHLLCDEDHFIRLESAKALGGCQSMVSRNALLEALGDRSVAVQEMARASLLRRGEVVPELPSPVSLETERP